MLGCLLGWGVSRLLPVSYRAETRISVAYNADADFSQPDDYKNWQMYQLNAFVLAPDILTATLERLNNQDASWQTVSADDLRGMLSASWRNTGVWRLSATDANGARAAALALAWTQTILESYRDVSQAAGAVVAFDHQLAATAQTEADLKLELARLEQINQKLSELRQSFSRLPAQNAGTPGLPDQLLAVFGSGGADNPGMQVLLDQLPSADSANQEIITWIDRMQPVLHASIQSAEAQASILASEREQLTAAYLAASDQSRGLSATLEISPLFDGIWQVQAIRSSSLVVLVGGLVGVLAWGLYWTYYLTRKYRVESA